MAEEKDKKKIALDFGDSPVDQSGMSALEKALSQLAISPETLAKGECPLQQLIKQTTGSAKKKAPSLAFTELPAPKSNFLGLFKPRIRFFLQN